MTATATQHQSHAPVLPLSAVLRRVHDRWLQEVRAQLEPSTLSSTSTVWDRWGAARYLTDQFNYHFQTAGRLLDRLRDRLAPEAAARLMAEREALERIRDELGVLGRRQGTAAPVAVLARAMIGRLACWCADMEVATQALSVGELDQEVVDLLRGFEAAPATS